MNIHARDALKSRSIIHRDAPAVAAALRPDQPVFCFSPARLRADVATFRNGFPGEVSYAVKANALPDIVTAVAGAGIAIFDVASVEEMDLVRALSPAATVHYHNPVKSRTEIGRAAAVHGCRRFAVDDAGELSKIMAVIGPGVRLEIAVRFRLPHHGASAHDFSTKFGATPAEAAELLRLVAAGGHAPVLTFHPGSQCIDPEAYGRYIVTAAEIAATAGVRLARLNVGGGFPARYRHGAVPSPAAFFAAIARGAAAAFAPEAAPALECEPGRGLVAGAMSLLTRVKLVKPGRREIYLNDGIYGALMEMSQAPSLTPSYRVIRNGVLHSGAGAAAGAVEGFIAYGPTCDPLDRLPGELMLPGDIAEDDYVEFAAVGAYGAATSTRFNGYGTAALHLVHRV